MPSYDEFLSFIGEKYGLSVDEIKETNSFVELGLDSLSLFSLLEEVETMFEVKVEADDISEIDTAEKMYKYLIKGAQKKEV